MSATQEREAGAALRAIRNDPVGFCREVLSFEPWSRQAAILRSVRDHQRTAVRACHGSGKTSVAARVVIWFLASHPRSRVITTAPTARQVRDVLWPEIASAFRASEGFIDGELTDTRLELASDWFALGLSTDRPERFQGHHAEYLLLVVDEASGVAENIWEASEGFLTTPSSRVLAIGNPTKPSGQFFRAFHSERSLWNTITISAFDMAWATGESVPDAVARRLVSREWVDAARKKWGEGSPLWDVRVLGSFPSQADDTVLPLADVEEAQMRSVEPGTPLVVAADIARFGSDETVIAVRKGPKIRIAETYGGRDTMTTVGRILRVAREVQAQTKARPTIVVDDVGVGGGVSDRLREVGEFRVVAFNAGASPRAPLDYPNRRSEVWFNFAERLPEIDLDRDEQLAADLVSPRYTIDSRGRRVVEPKADTKKRLGRSPDRADAVLMSFAVDGTGGSAEVGFLPNTIRDSSDFNDPPGYDAIL